MMDATLSAILPSVIALVHEAGQRLAVEFARPTGPRFSDRDTAPIDEEIEHFLHDGLTRLFPARFVGEESGIHAAEANGFCWVVDPHDGTRACLEGRRGSAISVGLLQFGTPVLGVVYAPLSPDRGSDMIAWAQGLPITRNGEPVEIDLRQRQMTPTDVVFLNHGAGQRPVWNTTRCAPARFMPLPSIAYRLARLAVGDGIATVTLRPVNAHDIAAGHALLTAAGGVLLTEDGEPVTYTVEGVSTASAGFFGGAPSAVATLRSRAWRGSAEPRREPHVTLNWPRVADPQRLDRACGSMLGLVIADTLGASVEFLTRSEIAEQFPAGVRDLVPSPIWHGMAGQPTDDSELAIALARSLVRHGGYDADDAATAYADWFASGPFTYGNTTAQAFAPTVHAIHKAEAARAAASRESQSNGSLMRIAPIALCARDPEDAARMAQCDSALSHPHPVCQAACAAFTAAITIALQGAGRSDMLATATRIAASLGSEPIVAALRRAERGEPVEDFQHRMGWVLIAFQNAFFHLCRGTPVEAAIIETVGQGGDADTNGAIAGALLGAADGRDGLPTRWTMPVLTCRPFADPDSTTRIDVHPTRPRPDIYWPDDLLDLTEALLLIRSSS
jgi:ADP-ribosyl-[dinitrogen reductase] hydrolase